MDDVNEWSTECGAILTKIDDLDISPYYWHKKCLFVAPVKRSDSYTWKVGVQCFRLPTDQTYTLVTELYNKDLLMCNKTSISFQGSSGITIEGHNTQKVSISVQYRNVSKLHKDISSIQKNTR